MDKQLIKDNLLAIEDLALAIWNELKLDEVEDPTLKEKNLIVSSNQPTQHPLGNKIDEAWLAIKITKLDVKKNTALIWYVFPGCVNPKTGLEEPKAYYYTPEKIEYDNQLAWKVEEGKYYIVHNEKWDYKDRWVWNKIWEVPFEVYDNIAFKVSKKIKPNDSILRMEEDRLLDIPDDQLTPIQVIMKGRALNRLRIMAQFIEV